MGSTADRVVELAIRALRDHDLLLAEMVIAGDDTIDEMDLEIEQACIRLIALQQPMARDLRLIGTALKITTDIERIGDHAVDIAKVARKLARDSAFAPPDKLFELADHVRTMLDQAIAAFGKHDLDMVHKVVLDDDRADDMFHEIRDDLHLTMKKDPAAVVQASYLLFVAHYLERIADHAVNIAERVSYVETGALAQLAKSHKGSS